MKHGAITITFEHYWHCGSGQAGEGDVDLLPVVEDCGLPYVPGRALRGRLKWAAREAGWGHARLDAFFGQEDARNLDSMGRLHVTSATMRDQFALNCRREFAQGDSEAEQKRNVAMAPALFEDIASTSLEKGAAKPNTLRRVRYAVPVTAIADVSLEEDALRGVTWQDLQDLVGKVRAIGKGKHDGFGWCKAELSDPHADDQASHAGGEETPSGAGTADPQATAFDLELELLDDVVLSANSATVGGHRTLDHVPGSSLMGAFARKYFERLRKKDLATAEQTGAEALLTGAISFGNGVPIGSGGVATVPTPLSWYHAKDEQGVLENSVQSQRVSNLAARGYEESEIGAPNRRQPVQMREGWLDHTAGRLISVRRTETLKTAIDTAVAKYETAKESALYGYEAIAKGGRFISRIELKGTDADVCAALRESFDGKTIRLGRSKGTEFGRARCKLTPLGQARAAGSGEATVSASPLVLLAESDLALLDESGFPTLRPEPRHFGLGGNWSLSEKRSYLRFRRYSLWNAKRGSPDVERQVISKGSVLVFVSQGGNLTGTPRRRVGLGQAEGLGRARVVNILEAENWMGTKNDEHPRFANPDAKPRAPEAPAGTPLGHDLTPWITERHREKQFDVTANKLAQDWCRDWSRAKGKVSASQWGGLDEAARDADTLARLKQLLGTGAADTRRPKTRLGHGKWAKEDQKKLREAILNSLSQLSQEQERLTLAAFRAACHRMAAQTRRERD